MAKSSSIFVCQQCGYQSPTFLGRCPECSTWNSLVEQITAEPASGRKVVNAQAQIVDIAKIEKKDYARFSTGFEEFDRVLGGGVVLGSVVLVAGDPGIGKSTLLTQLALNLTRGPADPLAAMGPAASVSRVRPRGLTSHAAVDARDLSSASPIGLKSALYVSGEESAKQIKIRADRISPHAHLNVLNETDVDVILSAIEQARPSLTIIDSIQTLETQDLTAAAGSVSQVRECAHRLQHLAKRLHLPIFLVGHVTKEGTVAGPKTLEHLVDVVLNLEGDPTSGFRVLRGAKNRFGPTDEVGIFEMAESGMVEVQNPSKIFLEQKVDAPGSAVVSIIQGQRPLLVEIQALVTKTQLPNPRRVGTGVDNNRLQLLAAVLQKRLSLPLFDQDIFINVTGGLRVFEPAADLGICLAIASSLKGKTIPAKTVFVGEVGLLGELRAVGGLEKRAKEARSLGYSHILSFEQAKTLAQAVNLVLK
ncbi:DNA repair protein RadA [Candidatus Daviesbacteria bacterium]|nr:DNA repair protein RadA [Candidatus Daviesbacteria bacterium]